MKVMYKQAPFGPVCKKTIDTGVKNQTIGIKNEQFAGIAYMLKMLLIKYSSR